MELDAVRKRVCLRAAPGSPWEPWGRAVLCAMSRGAVESRVGSGQHVGPRELTVGHSGRHWALTDRQAALSPRQGQQEKGACLGSLTLLEDPVVSMVTTGMEGLEVGLEVGE